MPPPPLSVSTAGNLSARSAAAGIDRNGLKDAITSKMAARRPALSGAAVATSDKLLGTLQQVKQQVAANTEIKSMLKTAGGARRVPVKEAVPAVAASTPAAVSAAPHVAATPPAPVIAALEARIAALEGEKISWVAQLAAAQSEIACLRTTILERDNALAAAHIELQQHRVTITTLQDEKESLLVQIQHNGSSDTERSSVEPAQEILQENIAATNDTIPAEPVQTVACISLDSSLPLCLPAPMDEPIAVVRVSASPEVEASNIEVAAEAIAEANESSAAVVEQQPMCTPSVFDASVSSVPSATVLAAVEDEANAGNSSFAPVDVDELHASMNASGVVDPFGIEANVSIVAKVEEDEEEEAVGAVANMAAAEVSLNLSGVQIVTNGNDSTVASSFHGVAAVPPSCFLSNPASPAPTVAGEAGLLSPIQSSPLPIVVTAPGPRTPSAVPAPVALIFSPFVHTGSNQLSASALKIQERNRSRLASFAERYKTLDAGSRLAALGSSPAAVAAHPTAAVAVAPAASPNPSPVAKRRRLTTDGPSGNTSRVSEEGEVNASSASSCIALTLSGGDAMADLEAELMEGEGLLAQRELSFGDTDDADNQDEDFVTADADADTAPLPIISRAALLQTATKTPSASSATVTAAAASPSSSSTLNRSCSSASSSVSSLSVSDQKRLSSELKMARGPIVNIEADWNTRSKMLQRIEQLVKERGAGGMMGWNGWAAELVALQRPLAAQLSDLRSSILREACRTVVAVAEASPREFEESGSLAFYAPLLWKGLYVTIRVISQTSDETMTELTQLSASTRSVPLFLTCLSDTHGVVREKCANYLLQIITSCPTTPSTTAAAEAITTLDMHLPALASAAKSQMQATEGPVRASWRALWHGLRTRFPSPHTQLDAAQNDFPQPVLKALEQDRKGREGAAAKSSSLAGAKRKK